MLFTKLNSEFSNSFYQLIEKHDNVFITSHFSPDDDAMSSTLSLYYLLTKTYPTKSVRMINSSLASDRYSCFLNYSKIDFSTDITKIIEKNTLVIYLDGGQYYRFTNQPDNLKNISHQSICIDHHLSPTDEFDLILQESTSSSTAELIYLLAPNNIKTDPNFASLVLFGLLGDTGTFNYVKPGQIRVFDIVKEILISTNIDIQEYKAKYNYISLGTFEVIKEFIKNTKYSNIKNWPDFSYSYLSRDYVKKNKLDDKVISEASDIYSANYLRMIDGYSWGITLKPHSD